MKPKIKTVKAWAHVDRKGSIRLSTINTNRHWLLALDEKLGKLGWTIRRIKITGL